MRRLSVPLMVAAFAGCMAHEDVAYRWERVTGPDGYRDWFAIECKETFDCYKISGKLCKDGYDVNSGAPTESAESDGMGTRVGNAAFIQGRSKYKHGAAMLIRCKPSRTWGHE